MLTIKETGGLNESVTNFFVLSCKFEFQTVSLKVFQSFKKSMNCTLICVTYLILKSIIIFNISWNFMHLKIFNKVYPLTDETKQK